MTVTVESAFADLLAFLGSVDPSLQSQLIAGQQRGNNQARWNFYASANPMPNTDLRVRTERNIFVTTFGIPTSAALQSYNKAIFVGNVNYALTTNVTRFIRTDGSIMLQPRIVNKDAYNIFNSLTFGGGLQVCRYDGYIFGYDPVP